MSPVENLPDEELEAISQEVAEAIPAIRKFVGLSTDDKFKVLKSIADKQVGSEETAVLKSIPGFPSMLLEPVSDAALDMIFKLIRKLFIPEEVTE